MNSLMKTITKSFCVLVISTFLFFSRGEYTTEALITRRQNINISKTTEISKQQEKYIKIVEEKETSKKTTTPKKVTKTTTVKKETKKTTKKVEKENNSGNRIIISNILNKNLMKDETGDNFYLNHNINGKYDGIGVPYIDFRTNFDNRKMIIYAHSSKSGNGPFQVLQKYHNNKSFYENNKYITIKYDGKTYKYQIFSVYVAAADSEESEELEYFHKMIYSNETWNNALQRYKSKSEYDTGVEVNGTDKILILQTCSMDSKYYQKYYRYNLVIMAKLISVN